MAYVVFQVIRRIGYETGGSAYPAEVACSVAYDRICDKLARLEKRIEPRIVFRVNVVVCRLFDFSRFLENSRRFFVAYTV